VTILKLPLGFTDACTVSNGSGTVGSGNVTDIAISCHAAVASVSTVAGNPPFTLRGTAVDASGNVYAASVPTNEVLKITPSGIVSTFAGGGAPGNMDGTGSAASFNQPIGLAVDAAGNVYVADSGNNEIRKITPAGAVTTLAGNGTAGNADGNGAAASFFSPSGVAIDAAGNVYVADEANNEIRKITSTGAVTTLAGNGYPGSSDGTAFEATFNAPNGVGVDATGNVYVADSGNREIRKITLAGVVSTLAGPRALNSNDGIGSSASFSVPAGVAVDAAGNVYVADSGKNEIRKITPH